MAANITALFWNTHENRPRAGLRILIVVAIFALIMVALQFAALGGNELAMRVIYPLGMILASLLGLWLGGRFYDRRTLSDFGLHLNARWWADLGFGLLLGALLMAAIFAVETAAGWVQVTGTFHSASALPFWPTLALGLWHFVAVGISEELVTRGYLLRNLAEGMNLKRVGARRALLLAYLLSSAMFGLFHIFNPNSSWVSTLLLVAAGLFLGLGFVLTGELAIPIGLHISWNFVQGRVFGFPVSGGKAGTTLISIQQGGPAVWTGGDFGPEAGLIGLAAIVLGCVLTLLWVKWRYKRIELVERLAAYQPKEPSL
jgi:uncharacterized protein